MTKAAEIRRKPGRPRVIKENAQKVDASIGLYGEPPRNLVDVIESLFTRIRLLEKYPVSSQTPESLSTEIRLSMQSKTLNEISGAIINLEKRIQEVERVAKQSYMLASQQPNRDIDRELTIWDKICGRR